MEKGPEPFAYAGAVKSRTAIIIVKAFLIVFIVLINSTVLLASKNKGVSSVFKRCLLEKKTEALINLLQKVLMEEFDRSNSDKMLEPY